MNMEETMRTASQTYRCFYEDLKRANFKVVSFTESTGEYQITGDFENAKKYFGDSANPFPRPLVKAGLVIDETTRTLSVHAKDPRKDVVGTTPSIAIAFIEEEKSCLSKLISKLLKR